MSLRAPVFMQRGDTVEQASLGAAQLRSRADEQDSHGFHLHQNGDRSAPVNECTRSIRSNSVGIPGGIQPKSADKFND